MAGSPRITVAGAGALGLSAALALADAGAAVTVFDPAAPSDNASGVAAGMLAPAFEAALDETSAGHFDLLLAARDRWPGLEARIGITVDRAGAAAVGDPAFLQAADAALRRLGLHPTDLPRTALEGLAPGLSQAWGRGVLTREDWRVDVADALAALRRACEAVGVVFRHEAATGFEGADRLVIATGAARELAIVAPELAALTPIKGHILRGSRVREGIVVRGEGGYVAPTSGGYAVGATMQPGRGDRELEPEALIALRRAGARLFPDIGHAVLTGLAGVRAATPDGLPLVGRGRHNGVLLAVGARRNGWLLAPMVGALIAACVTEREAGPFATRLDPGRFG